MAFLIIYPFSLFVWIYILKDWNKVATISMLPVLVAYVVPAIGTNLTGLWEFSGSGRLGKFRWYHGFVLGASINIFGSMMYAFSPQYQGVGTTAMFAFVMGSFVAFWNWYYDIYAIKSGFIIVNNKAKAEGKSAEEITVIYAPIYFFILGAVYGLYIKMAQLHFAESVSWWLWFAVFMHILALVLPTAVYACVSKKIDGNWGISKYSSL